MNIIVRTTGLKVECGGCYWYEEYRDESEASVAYHVVNDVLSSMMLDGVIGEYKVSLINEKHFQIDDEEE